MIDFFICDSYFLSKLIFGFALLALGLYQNFKLDFIRKNGVLVNGVIIDYFEKIDELSDYKKNIIIQLLNLQTQKISNEKLLIIILDSL